MKRKPHKIKPRKNILRSRAFWLTVLILILLGTFFYFLAFFDKFQIKRIIVSGNEKIGTSRIERLVAEKIPFFNSQSIFLISAKKIKSAILEEFPEINSADIRRKLFDTLLVSVSERQPLAVFCQMEECFLIDETGVVYETANATAGFPIVWQSEQKEVALGSEAINKEIMGYIAEIKKQLNDIEIKTADIMSDSRMNIKTSEGWEAYFDLSSNMGLQITKLVLLLEKELPKEKRGKLQYIDLRFEDRAYYK